MVESGPFIEYCGQLYVNLDAVLVPAVLYFVVVLVVGFCWCTAFSFRSEKSQG